MKAIPHPPRAALRGGGHSLSPTSACFAFGGAALIRNLALLILCTARRRLQALVALTDGLLAPAKRLPVLGVVTTNMIQWGAIALGLCSTASWIAAMRRRDPQAAHRILLRPSFVALAVGGGVLSLGGYGLSAFMFLSTTRYLGAVPAGGLILGIISALAGGGGTALGGILADAARRRHPADQVFVACGAVTLSSLCLLVQYSVESWPIFLAAHALATLCSPCGWGRSSPRHRISCPRVSAARRRRCGSSRSA